jgi:hypothetical protein
MPCYRDHIMKTSMNICECNCCNAAHVHRPPQIRQTSSKINDPQMKDIVYDHCTRPDIHLKCPNNPRHEHWSPKHGTCNYPNTCKAHCFDHFPQRDWAVTRPTYVYYLEETPIKKI